MTILSVLVTLLHVVVAVFLILVVLLQQGKGADLAVFGGGSTQAAFGARGAATLFHKLTVAGFVVFTLTTISMAVIEGRRHGTSVMGGVPAKTAKAPAAAAPATTPPAGATTAPAPGGAAPATQPPASQPAQSVPATPAPAPGPTGS